MTATAPLAGRAASDGDYERLGLSRGTVAPWGDVPAPAADAAASGGGTPMRTWTTARARRYLSDQGFTELQKPLAPLVRINLDLPDGHSLQKVQRFTPGSYSAATGHADV